MDLPTITNIVSIIAGIIAIILGLKIIREEIKWPSVSGPVNVIIYLMATIGIVIFIYGGFIFASAIEKTDSNRQFCLEGREQNSFAVN